MFRHYNHDGEKVLPKHLQSVSTSMPSPPASPQEQYMTDEELADYALDVFFRDYCVHPADPALSRGYLQGVAAMIRKSGGNSGIANAARIIGIDGIGRRWGKEPLKQKAQWLYQAELRAFQTRMSDESLAHSTESFMIITLFGLYEVSSVGVFRWLRRGLTGSRFWRRHSPSRAATQSMLWVSPPSCGRTILRSAYLTTFHAETRSFCSILRF